MYHYFSFTHRTDVHVGGHEEEGRGEENKGVFSRSFRIKERKRSYCG